MIDYDHACGTHWNYSMGCDDYIRLRDRSREQCEICGSPAAWNTRGVLYIDHDHALGWKYVRGLVCARCNVRLGHVDRGDRPPTPDERAYLDHPWWWARKGLDLPLSMRGGAPGWSATPIVITSDDLTSEPFEEPA